MSVNSVWSFFMRRLRWFNKYGVGTIGSKRQKREKKIILHFFTESFLLPCNPAYWITLTGVFLSSTACKCTCTCTLRHVYFGIHPCTQHVLRTDVPMEVKWASLKEGCRGNPRKLSFFFFGTAHLLPT
ncbi:hypothetical protein I7I53_04988 [Histoplasma capsulatum var. duboisii H88]|uniref:Uncharacterized protein n=1 Tax=Ajellomyces capsulatus (strain H88) TaxID=544711 RepID=A0A8A1LVY5_AJEC8|nr:hypothetical protein I7I53_04988 [Histoplasma capsulatum var. duboisii H88]